MSAMDASSAAMAVAISRARFLARSAFGPSNWLSTVPKKRASQALEEALLYRTLLMEEGMRLKDILPVAGHAENDSAPEAVEAG